MSFRTRLILAFTLLALVQAFFFTLLSDRLLREGLDAEASERLALLGSLFPRELYESDWPPPAKPNAAWETHMLALLKDYAENYGLEAATLLVDKNLILDSRATEARLADVAERWKADGLSEPKLNGVARISGPLFQGMEGWHKSLYLKVARERSLWLRLEVGDQFLGALAAVQKRLRRLALALALPSLGIGLLLGLWLSRRARDLARQLEGTPRAVALEGSDEFSLLALKVNSLIQSLERERQVRESLLQDRIRQARHLAFGVAHELRNPLAGLSLSVDLLRRKSAEAADLKELEPLSARVQQEAARLEGIVARFLDFARTPVIQAENLDLTAISRLAAAGLKPAPLISGQVQGKADPKAAALILGVLLGNAAEAAGDAGWVTLDLEQRATTAALRVKDSGEPIPEAERERLFTPFFTTKPKGMGLGLATASSLADAMGGRLSLLEDGKTFEWVVPG
jgi:signal transduction histidine kinase